MQRLETLKGPSIRTTFAEKLLHVIETKMLRCAPNDREKIDVICAELLDILESLPEETKTGLRVPAANGNTATAQGEGKPQSVKTSSDDKPTKSSHKNVAESFIPSQPPLENKTNRKKPYISHKWKKWFREPLSSFMRNVVYRRAVNTSELRTPPRTCSVLHF